MIKIKGKIDKRKEKKAKKKDQKIEEIIEGLPNKKNLIRKGMKVRIKKTDKKIKEAVLEAKESQMIERDKNKDKERKIDKEVKNDKDKKKDKGKNKEKEKEIKRNNLTKIMTENRKNRQNTLKEVQANHHRKLKNKKISQSNL